MKDKPTCPFCKCLLPKHNRNCFHSGIPSADSIRTREDKKRAVEVQKLTQAITDPNKAVIDGSGSNLRQRILEDQEKK